MQAEKSAPCVLESSDAEGVASASSLDEFKEGARQVGLLPQRGKARIRAEHLARGFTAHRDRALPGLITVVVLATAQFDPADFDKAAEILRNRLGVALVGLQGHVRLLDGAEGLADAVEGLRREFLDAEHLAAEVDHVIARIQFVVDREQLHHVLQGGGIRELADQFIAAVGGCGDVIDLLQEGVRVVVVFVVGEVGLDERTRFVKATQAHVKFRETEARFRAFRAEFERLLKGVFRFREHVAPEVEAGNGHAHFRERLLGIGIAAEFFARSEVFDELIPVGFILVEDAFPERLIFLG